MNLSIEFLKWKDLATDLDSAEDKSKPSPRMSIIHMEPQSLLRLTHQRLRVWGKSSPEDCCSSPVSAAEKNTHEALVTSDYITKTALLWLGHQLILGADIMLSTTPQKLASYPLLCARHHASCFTQITSIHLHSALTRSHCSSHVVAWGHGSTERGHNLSKADCQ